MQMPNDFIISNDININCAIYDNFLEKYSDFLYLKERIIVTPTSKIVEEINKKKKVRYGFRRIENLL